jgi:hypothetical protein
MGMQQLKNGWQNAQQQWFSHEEKWIEKSLKMLWMSKFGPPNYWMVKKSLVPVDDWIVQLVVSENFPLYPSNSNYT